MKKLAILICALGFSGLTIADADRFSAQAEDSTVSSCSTTGQPCWKRPCCAGLVCTGGEWSRSCRSLTPCQSDAECEPWQTCFAVGGGPGEFCIP